MDYNNITNPEIKAIIDGLKYYSTSIESDVLQALEEAENEEDFIGDAKGFLGELCNEIKEVTQSLTEATNEEITIHHQECGDKLQVVVPKQIESPVRMLQGVVNLHCKAMPCYTPNNLHKYCMMGGCGKIHETIVMFGPIVGIQIVTEAVRRYEPEYDMEYLLEDVIKEIVGTI